MRCCVEDEGFVALRRRPAGGGVKPPHAALAEDCRGVVNMNVEGGSASSEVGLLAAVLCEEMEVVWPSGAALRGGGFKPPASALAEDRCGERRGKRRDVITSGGDREDERWAEALCR